ncbi:ABA4-like family protein [Maricaulis sp.]|uniref:ABA4-like family protein n=1 Tax=Maricaulis sp. TaxID=1486257 RepID=UPI0026372685|nr:ABA4-like family protein [Maricaulis sp.]
MSWDIAYLALNALVLPAWVLLIVLPRSGLTRQLVHSMLYPLVIGGIYLVSLGAAMAFGVSDPDAGMSSLSAVMSLFDHPNGIITGWSHYLAFDLFVGAWIARDAARRGIGHLVTVPALLLSFSFGPLGLMTYALTGLIVRKPVWRLEQ